MCIQRSQRSLPSLSNVAMESDSPGNYRSPLGEGNGTPLQCSCLENPVDRGAWWAAVHGVAKSWARLSYFTFTFHFHALEKEMATHSSVLAWRIPGTGEPGGLQSMESHRVRHDCSDLAAAAPKWVSSPVCHFLLPFISEKSFSGWPLSRVSSFICFLFVSCVFFFFPFLKSFSFFVFSLLFLKFTALFQIFRLMDFRLGLEEHVLTSPL